MNPKSNPDDLAATLRAVLSDTVKLAELCAHDSWESALIEVPLDVLVAAIVPVVQAMAQEEAELRSTVTRLTEERDRLSQLADERHDAIFQAHRQRDDSARQLAALTEERDEIRRVLQSLQSRMEDAEALLQRLTAPAREETTT